MAHETVGRVLTADLSTQLLPITWHGVCSAETYCGFFSPTASTLSTGIKSDRQSHIPGMAG